MNQQRLPIQMRFHLTRQQLLNPMNGSIGSPTFYVSRTPNSIEYNVNVFPNGRSPAESGRFLVFLQFKFPENLRIYASYNFNVGGTMQRSFQHSYKSSSSFGGILCPRQLLFYPTPMLVNDRLWIELFGHVIIQRHSSNPRLTSVRTNQNLSSSSLPTSSNSPMIKEDLKERRTPKNGEAPPTPKKEQPVVVKDSAAKTVTNDENETPIDVEVSKEAGESEAIGQDEHNVTEDPSDIHEPPPRSPEPRPNSETTETDSHPNDSSSSATTEEPNRNKRVRTRTSRYVEFVVEEDDVVEEPVSKKSRKRKSMPGQSPNINVNKKMLIEKSKCFAALFEKSSENSLELEGIPDRTLEAAFNFCHGLPLKDMNNRECFSLLFFAETFEIPELKNILEELLLEKIALTNACDIANAAVMSKAEKLKNYCKKYVIENIRNNSTLRNYNILEGLLLEKIALTNACDIANAAIMSKAEKLKNYCKKYVI
uniref:BTB domain-containing protein n=1 Tax=Panagrolaimus sp. ES5 TaxID=591445 RepID=A0AC34FKB9_9BILA